MNITKHSVKLISEVRKHPYLYDKNDRRYKQKEDEDKAWDTIAAGVYEDQWANLTYAEKAKKGEYILIRF